ncbi:HipA domain-containing protein [Phocaeicola barnesiae]
MEEMYRRMIFNYLTDNKDDHCKNFSFICKQTGRENGDGNLLQPTI